MGDDKDPESQGPSLELPSLFGRRKKKASKAASTPVDEPADPTEPGSSVDVADDPVDDPTTEIADPPLVAAEPGPEPDPEPADPPPVADEPAEAPADEPTVVFEEPADPPLVAESDPADPPLVAEAPAPEPEPADPVEARGEPEVVTPAEPVPPLEPRVSEPAAADPEPDDRPAAPSVPVAERLRSTIPAMAANTAAIVVGALVGLLGCLATWIGLQGCEVVTGAQTCGGPGLLVLIAIVVAMILLGAALLRMLGVPEPGNLSFLGVGIMSVVALVFLVDYLYDAWMFAVIPVVTALAFSIAQWITTKYTDDGSDDRVSVDVR